MANLTRDEILARKTGRGTVELPGGGTVEIRGLSHAEVIEGQTITDLNERNCFMVAHALVDPAMTIEDVIEWSREGAAGDITTVCEHVQVLSRLTEGAGKSRVSRARRRS